MLSRRLKPLLKLLPKRFRKLKPVVPVIRLYGPIGTSFPSQGSLSLAGLASQIETAFEVDDAKAVALVIRSPGGAAAQSHLIFQRIRALAAEKDRKVFAFIEDVGASGGYMLACAADEIYADPSSVVGSIGVVSAGFGLTGLIGKLGIERRVHASGASKAMLDPFMPEKSEDVARLKELQADVHQSFIDLVKSRRGERLMSGGENLFDGSFWTGRKAMTLGLVDGLGDVRSVMRERFGEDVELRLVAPPARGGLLRFLIPGMSAAPGAGLPPGGGLVNVAEALSAAEARALWARYGL